MELITPTFTHEFIESISKIYPENCFGCEHLRVIPESKTNLCVLNERPCKVDALNPALTNPTCKFTAVKNPFAYDTLLSVNGRIMGAMSHDNDGCNGPEAIGHAFIAAPPFLS